MKLTPLEAKGVQVGFTVHAETALEAVLLDALTSNGDRWKGWMPERGKLLLYPDPQQFTERPRGDA